MENWLRTPSERELTERDREIVQPLLPRVGDQASVVAELVLGPERGSDGRGVERMNEALRHEIVQRHQAGASLRAIARELGISRGAVVRVLARVQAQRDGRAATRHGRDGGSSIIDAFEPILKELLARYPNLTVERALQELRHAAFSGGYTVVRQRVRLLRPRPAPAPGAAL